MVAGRRRNVQRCQWSLKFRGPKFRGGADEAAVPKDGSTAWLINDSAGQPDSFTDAALLHGQQGKPTFKSCVHIRKGGHEWMVDV
jgi:hypothetical protein